MPNSVLLCVILLLQLLLQGRALKDPSDYFQGALQRPRLEILSPDNGEVLDSGNLDIRMRVADYDFKARYTSTVCVALSSLDLVAEQCFEDSDVVFHADGLKAGRQYSLRIVLFERGDAIAVSVRSFRVAGIATMVGSGEVVTIKTALQVAMQLQATGMEKAAEEIYRCILNESPAYPDALHLLGVSLYQQGDPEEAVNYIEKALQSEKSYEGFHNSLGECYRILGRLEAARAQFELALALNPLFKSAMFNMGLVFQQQKQWQEAINQFQKVANFASLVDGASGSILAEGSAERQLAEESKIRECDLLQSLGLLHKAMQCWSEGIKLFPTNHVLFNELGTSYAEGGDYETALQLFLESTSLGSQVADFNAGHMLELQGLVKESRKTFESSLARADASGLTAFHIRLRLATLLPRIMPSEEELTDLRNKLEKALDVLLAFESGQIVDNSSPLHFGYSLLSHLAYHGRNNLNLKLKLAQVYLKLCPALKNAVFLDKYEDAVPPRRGGGVAQIEDSSSRFKMDTDGKSRRIGFASRFLSQGHASGELVQGVIRQLTMAGLEVFVFFIDDDNAGSQARKPDSLGDYDHVRTTISASAHTVFSLPVDIAKAAEVIRAHRLDFLVYPDIGLEPVCYFMAFSRLAPVQIAWLGHADTTGLVDYFLTSDSEEEGGDRHYSEKLIRMKGFGTHFVHHNQSGGSESNDRSIVLETLKIPKVAHLYVVVSHLSRLNPLFDSAIAKILQNDRTAYVVIVDSGRQRKSLEQIFLDRLAQKAGGVITRVVFYSSANLVETRRVIRAASVVLDPFPSAGCLTPSLQALSLGTPVITLPSDRMAGRMTLGLYRIMEYTPSSLVVDSPTAYVSAALSVAHQPTLRRTLVDKIQESHSKLFPQLLDKETGEASSETLELQKDWTEVLNEILRRSNK